MRGRRRIFGLCACLLIGFIAIACIWLHALKLPQEPPQQDRVRLSFWTVSESYAEYMLSCAQRYNEQTDAEKIDLDVQVYSRSFIVDQINKSLMNDDQIPDLADIRFVDMHQFVNSAEHTMVLYPLNSLLDSGEAPRNSALEPFSFNGILLALPYGSGEMALFVNEEILERYGGNPEDLDSWEALSALGEELKADGVGLLAVDVNNWDLLLAGMLQRDAALANASDAQAIVRSDAFGEVYAALEDAVRDGAAVIPEDLDIYNQSFYAAFEAGEYMCVAAPMEYAYTLINNMPGLSGRIGIYPLPGVEQSGESALVAQYGTAILARGKNIRLTKHFLQYAKLGEDRYREMADALYVSSISAESADACRAPQNVAFAAYFGEDALRAFTASRERGFSGASGLPEAVLPLTEALLGACENGD